MASERADETYVGLIEAAHLLGLSPKSIRNRLSRKDPEILALGPVQPIGRRWRFPVNRLRAALNGAPAGAEK